MLTSPDAANPPAPDARVRCDARAFTINGRRELLLSAGIHYFRVPRALWADRIAKAKRGGMNAVETYVAWNFHEPETGAWDWSGDRDLGAFLDECARQGMYAIVRPGPYICAEWDFGGFPAWLANVPGVAFRQKNQPYLDAVGRYLDQVCPILAARQYGRGDGDGTVVLVQVENEYANLRWTRGEGMIVDDEYQRWVRDGLLARGIDAVPLITCAGHCEGTVECVNSHNPGDEMPAFRARTPDAPLWVTEFWTAWYDAWGGPHHTRSAGDIEYASWRCWSEGASGYNYYVYHGGTNFGYTPMYRQTTSYDYDAPLSETGRPTDKWRACRRVALFAHAFKDILLNGEHRRELRAARGDDERPLVAHETHTKQNGGIVWVYNPDKEHTVIGSVAPYLPEIALGPRTLFPYVHDVPFGATANYLGAYAALVKSDAYVLTAHIRPDPHEGLRVYVYGEPGERREVALFHGAGRGEGVAVAFSADAPNVYPVGPSQVIALTTEMAGLTWVSDDPGVPTLIGPDDVRDHGATEATVEVAPGRRHTLFALHADGTLTEIDIEAPPLPAPPALSAWETFAEPDCAAPDFDDADWTEIEEPTSMSALGNGSEAYGWYRAVITTDEAFDGTLHFAACSDRLTLWVNGEKVGSSAIPPEDRRGDWTATFDVRVKEGRNVLCVLADNLGLIKGDWQIGKDQSQEKKGIYGPVTLAPNGGCYLMEVARWRFRGKLYGERHGWAGFAPPRPPPGGALPAGASVPPGALWARVLWHRATFGLNAPLDSATPLLLRLTGMGKGTLFVNGRNLGRYWPEAGPQTDYYLPEPWLNVGENVVVLAETGGRVPGDGVSLVWDERAAAVMRVAL